MLDHVCTYCRFKQGGNSGSLWGANYLLDMWTNNFNKVCNGGMMDEMWGELDKAEPTGAVVRSNWTPKEWLWIL